MNALAIQQLLAERQNLSIPTDLAEALEAYLKLLLKWNARTNLSAIRAPEAIVLRHFGESLQCARAIPPGVQSLMDFGSGAGFPGAICCLQRPEVEVTLAESQSKKAAFLREVCRTLPISARVHASRVETLPPDRRFDVVTLRAVDRMDDACQSAYDRVREGGWLMLLTTEAALVELGRRLEHLSWASPIALQGSASGVVGLGQKFVT